MNLDIAHLIININRNNNTINWDAVSAIGTCFAAFATFLACVIALWQTKYANYKKLKLKFYDDAYSVTSDQNICHFININVCNIGNRKITIKELSIPLKNRKKLILFVNQTKFLPTKLPQTLDIEESIDLYFEYDLLLANLQNAVKQKQLDINSKITFIVKDNSEKYFSIKSKKKIKDYLESSKITKEGGDDL